MEPELVKRGRGRHQREYKSYMGEVSSYLDKVRAGRAIRDIDPKQPAFDERSEMLRQIDKIDKANAYDRLMRNKRDY